MLSKLRLIATTVTLCVCVRIDLADEDLLDGGAIQSGATFAQLTIGSSDHQAAQAVAEPAEKTVDKAVKSKALSSAQKMKQKRDIAMNKAMARLRAMADKKKKRRGG